MKEGEEQGGDTEVETSSQGRRTPRQPTLYTPSGKEYLEVSAEVADKAMDPNSMEELIDQEVENVERTIDEQQSMSSGHVSSSTIDLNCGEGPSVKKSKSVRLSAIDILSERVVPLLRYLDGKMAK